MTRLQGSLNGWFVLPSPQVDFIKEVESYCKLAIKKYGSILRAVIIWKGVNGEFYVSGFWNGGVTETLTA